MQSKSHHFFFSELMMEIAKEWDISLLSHLFLPQWERYPGAADGAAKQQ